MCQGISQEEKHSISKQIIPTKCKSSLKQYLPKKPSKWGIQVWARCGVSGLVYDFDIYTGKVTGTSTNQENLDPTLGMGGNVVMRLTSNLPQHVNHKVYFDNLFNSIALISKLKRIEFGQWVLFVQID